MNQTAIAAAFRSRLSANSPVPTAAISWEFFAGPGFPPPTIDIQGDKTTGNWIRPSIAFATTTTPVYGGGNIFNDFTGALVIQCFAWWGLTEGAASTLCETLAISVRDIFGNVTFSGIECLAPTLVYVAPERDSKYQQINVNVPFRASEARAVA